MAHLMLRAALLAGATLFILPATAQEQAPDLVVTPNRQAQSLQEIGSAVTVIPAEEIERAGVKSVRDVLDGQPGIVAAESGGPGGFVSIYMRGTETRHTLVLIDGVRAGDPSTTSGEVDLSLLSPQSIERIEIVRGPQSALYGSDAIGGVINIITKKGRKGPPVWTLRTEGGSYGSYGSKLAVSGGTDDITYAFALNQFRTDGFQRYGYRVARLAFLNPNGTDPFERFGGSGRVSWRANDWLTLETGFNVSRDTVQYDAASGGAPLAPNHQGGLLASAYQRAIAENGPFRTTLTTFETRVKRTYESQYLDVSFPPPTNYISQSSYVGMRAGAELQEDIALGALGKFTIGTRYEREKSSTEYDSLSPFPSQSFGGAQQITRSAFALHQITLFDRLHLTAGGRIDKVSTSGVFNTYRLTAAYDLTSTTRIRASLGTGAKAPSIYQLTAPFYGNASLKPETSRGFDVGLEQTFLDGDARASVSWFRNRIGNLITADAPFYVYYNIASAETSGVEASVQYNLVPSFARLKATYNWLDAKDTATGLRLYRRPMHSGRISVAFTPQRDLTIEPILRLVGGRDDVFYNEATFANERVKLKPYARFDVVADYKLNTNVSVFARGENLTNVRYEDVYNYGTAGRSVYAGVQMTW